MTKTEAKKYVCRCMAVSLRAELDNGSGWIFAADDVSVADGDGERPKADLERVVGACEELIAELDRRGR